MSKTDILSHSKLLDSCTFSRDCLEKLLSDYSFESVLDIGSGSGEHLQVFNACGKSVTAVDIGSSCYFDDRKQDYTFVVGNYMDVSFNKTFDCIWASHILEHQLNVHLFLSKVYGELEPNGILAVTVPPRKPQIVGGHVSIWNAGLLLYNLVLAGFDCSSAAVKQYGYNISVIVRKGSFSLPGLSFDKGDIDQLKPWLPSEFFEGIDGDIKQLNWNV